MEHKFLDTSCLNRALTAPTDATGGVCAVTGGATGCITAPAQGDGASDRDGNRIMIDQINCLVNIIVPAQANATAADTSCVVFIALVQDQQTNAATFTSEQVFANPSASANMAGDPFRNMSNTARFRVLKMKRLILRIPTLTYDGTNIEQSGFHTNCRLSWKGKMPVQFLTTSTTGNVSGVTDNSVNLVAYCSNVELAPSFNCATRVRFWG